MNIVIDENIAFAKEAFETFGKVHLFPGREITNKALKEADILIVRSVTNVNRELLEDTPVKFTGTATIGSDHVDLNYLAEKGISFVNAKGCNADAVCEYVFAALFNTAFQKNITLEGKRIGIIGAGNIGSRVAKYAQALGLDVFKNDPPMQRISGSVEYCSIEEIYECDIITLHVPLNMNGPDKTYHLFTKENLSLLKEGVILINSSRGPVIKNSDLKDLIELKNMNAVLDVWEFEPLVDKELLNRIVTGTPHIAGYSLEGKVNGTVIIYNALCNFLNVKQEWKPSLPKVDKIFNIEGNKNIQDILTEIIPGIYDIRRDDLDMRKLLEMNESKIPHYFDHLRKEYPLRREFSNYNLKLEPFSREKASVLKEFRFKTSAR